MSDKKGKTNWFIKHKVLTVIGVLILLGVIVSASNSGKQTATKVGEQSSSQTQEKTTFKVGDVISIDDKKVSVTSIERNWNSGNDFIKPDSGNEYVKVQVSIENNSSDQISYNTFDWKMKDSKGVIKDVDMTTYSVDGTLGSGELAPKGKVSGFMVFQVPSGDAGLVLQYTSSFWTDKKLEINL